MQSNYDITIVGGGLIGSLLALALAHLPIKIALIDAAEKSPQNSNNFHDARSLALSPVSRNILSALNLWDKLIPFSTPIQQIHISDRGHFGFTRIKAEQYKIPALGHVIEFDKIKEIIESFLVTNKNIDIITPARVSHLAIQNQQAIVSFEKYNDKVNLATKLIIAADGAQSTARQILQIPIKKTAYQQTAIVGNIGLQYEHNNIAFERFTTQGPLALLPLGEKRYAYVWSMKSEDAKKIAQLDDQSFISSLQKQFGYRLGKFIWVGRRQQFPLELIEIQQTIHPHVIFIGNASHTLHPIAGQGFNLGLRDTAVLSQLITEYLLNKKSLIDPNLLRDFVKLRTFDQKSMIYFTDSLVKIFSNDYQPITLLRNLGLCMFDRMDLVKNIFAQKTMGFNGFISKLAVGLPLGEAKG